MTEIMDKGLTHSAKLGADSSTQNTTNTQKLIRPICPIGPKLWDIVKKRLHQASVILAKDDDA